MLVELLHWKEIKTATWILPRLHSLVQALQFLYSHLSLNRRLCFLQVFFLLNILPLVQTFRWWRWPNTSWGKYSVTRVETYQLCRFARGSSLREWSAVVSLKPAQRSLENPRFNSSGVSWYLWPSRSLFVHSIMYMAGLTVLLYWVHNLIATPSSVRLTQYCQVTSANNFFL